ncbi:PAAR domain-containing protein [Pseudorhodobacter sp. E13]|uniref:PAAR domain-containing protein n=1 Tax=Pseudorhodobacter sp. E13 TaxID=2487931 RepID=UPI002100FBE6|nr:PAAR domain-containing protein [Pseudorhodobacter sp. E13]
MHGGGPIATGFPTVLVGNLPASRISDIAVCPPAIPDPVVMGSPTVLIGKMPASRITDSCAHGGAVASGCPTVLIGTSGGGGGIVATGAPAFSSDCLRRAAASGLPFVM